MYLNKLETRWETQIIVLEQYYTRDELWEEWNTRCNTLFEGKPLRNVQKWVSMVGLYRLNIKCSHYWFERALIICAKVDGWVLCNSNTGATNQVPKHFVNISSVQAPFCDTMQPERGWYLDSEWKFLLHLLKATGFSVSERVRTLQKPKSEVQTLSELGGDSITNDYNAIKFWKASVRHLRLQLLSEVKRAQTNSSLYHGGRELSNAPNCPKYIR